MKCLPWNLTKTALRRSPYLLNDFLVFLVLNLPVMFYIAGFLFLETLVFCSMFSPVLWSFLLGLHSTTFLFFRGWHYPGFLTRPCLGTSEHLNQAIYLKYVTKTLWELSMTYPLNLCICIWPWLPFPTYSPNSPFAMSLSLLSIAELLLLIRSLSAFS